MFRSSPTRRHGPWWVSVVAVFVTVVLAGVARVVVGRRRHPVGVEGDGGAYAPEPLTGDPTSVEPADVVPM
jgi:hypothetical protein